MKRDLSNAPLNEVIFEVKWDPESIPSSARKDSQIIAGIFSEKIKTDYPFYEALDATKIPVIEEILKGIVQHRFRVAENRWPLVQIGVGVLSVNDLDDETKYEWQDYKSRCLKTIQNLLEIHPFATAITSISLRYVNTLNFDFKTSNIFDFLGEKMKVGVSFDNSLFSESNLDATPNSFNLKLSIPSTDIDGNLHLMFASGMKKESQALVWNLNFMSTGGAVPLVENLETWLDTAHQKIENVFFSLIENAKDEIK